MDPSERLITIRAEEAASVDHGAVPTRAAALETNTSTLESPPRSLGLFNLPNTLTTLRLCLAFVLFPLIRFHQWESGLAVFCLAAFTDWLDGHLARRHGLSSRLGRVYDPLVDKILILGVFVFFLEVRDTGLPGDAGWTAWMVVVLLAREFLVTGIRALLEERGVEFGADRLGKAKMFIQCAAIIWLFVAFALASRGPAPFAAGVVRDVLNGATVALTALSGVNYVLLARRHLA
jgi:CDP-diacylglycerol--glycerol-3-phosphate 3-phosphatidyltransferase